jgi:large subunit ribosomal protein L6
MSRIGKKPIPVPDKTTINFNEQSITVKGEKGSLTGEIHPDVELNIDKSTISVTPKTDNRKGRALQGLVRSLVANMVTGVSNGFERVLEISGIGYRADVKGNQIVFNLGYSHPIEFELPAGISAVIDKNNVIRLSGIDKELLGHTAASIRSLRPPEPYKGKGIKYAEEHIVRKAGKTGAK